MYRSGYVLRPVGGARAQCCQVTYVTCVDLKGWLPSSIVNYVAHESVASLAHVRRIVEARAERHDD